MSCNVCKSKENTAITKNLQVLQKIWKQAILCDLYKDSET